MVRLPVPSGFVFTSPARGRRRRALVGALVVGLLLAVGAALVVGSALPGDRIHRYQVELVVTEDGSAWVRESIDYDFGARAGHGIFREFPGYAVLGEGAAPPRPLDTYDGTVSDVVVRSATAPAGVVVEHSGGTGRLRIGDPDRTVRGRHRYVLDYRLSGVIRFGRVAVDAIGTGWDVPILASGITVTAPFSVTGLECVRGTFGSRQPCERADAEANRVSARVSDLRPNEGVTIYAGIGPAAPAAPSMLPAAVDLGGADPWWWLWPMLLVPGVFLACYLAGLLPAKRWARRAGRDFAWHGDGGPVDAVYGGPGLEQRRIDDVVADEQTTIQFVPPPDLTPAQGGLLLGEEISDDLRVAWLTQQAVEGWFQFDRDGGKTVLTWTAPRGNWASAPLPLQKIFAGRGRVVLGTYDATFAAGWKLIGAELRRWRQGSGLWDDSAEDAARTRQRVLVVAGALAAIGGGFLIHLAVTAHLLLAAAVAATAGLLVGVGAGAALSGRELPVRTAVGFAQRQLVEGFRRFFEVSEGRHAEEAATRGVLREYSAWAVALGELDHWTGALAAAALPPDTPGLRDTRRIRTLSADARTTSTPPSSTASGGSGGVSGGSSSGSGAGVGGGAGGGGGGRW